MNNKLILGTVQFGCQYGINSAGRPDEKTVLEILDLAYHSGITNLDTSSAYGNAEYILGKVLSASDSSFQIISKYPESGKSVATVLDQTLTDLHVSSVYGYLLHHFRVYQNNPEIWKEFLDLKERGKLKKIGFSLMVPWMWCRLCYHAAHPEILLTDDVPFDLVQFPYNVFDRQFEPYLELLHKRGVEIHVRSTFLQGVFFMVRERLPEKLKPLAPYLTKLDDYAQATDMTVAEVALNFNLQNPFIDGVLIGVDSVGQLQDNLRNISERKVELSIDVKEKELLNPGNWK